MAWSREEIKRVVVEVIQTLTKEKVPLDETLDPIAGLGLESDDGLEFACGISERLDFHFPDTLNPFIEDTGRRSRKLGEIVDLILPMVGN